jgi:hypothetical protein
MRVNLLDKQDFQSHQAILYSNGNALAMLILSGEGSLEMAAHLADFYVPAENLKERRDAQSSIISKMARTGACCRRDDGALGD